MKRTKQISMAILTCLFLLTAFAVELSGQSLFNGVNYQGVVRNASGDPLPNQSVSLEFRVHEATPGGSVVFSDQQNTSTDERGLVSVVIGKGTTVTGDLGTLNYADTDYYMEVLVDGSSLGTQRLEAVPMSLKSSSMVLSDIVDVDGTTPSAGEVLKWNGTDWSPAPETGGGGGAHWTENTANGIESEYKNVGIGSNAHNNKRLFIECDSMPTGILVINNDGSPGPEVPQGVISLVTVADKDQGTALVGYSVTGSSTVDSLFGLRTIADAWSGQANVFGAHCEAVGTGSGSKYGIYGRASGNNSYGVYGTTPTLGGYGIYGENLAVDGTAGYFNGKLFTNSWFSVDDVFTVRPNVSNSAVKLDMKNASDVSTVELFATGTNMGGGKVWISDAAGSTRIALNVNSTGTGRVITDELEIRGGSDLAEYFESGGTSTIEPGAVVVLDRNRPGRVKLSDAAYDRGVIGIVSGANGVKAGMMMGQEGSVTYGDVPVAIAGRAYVKVDERNGIIVPGDMLTTSDKQGHAMKVINWDDARGAMIGKALTQVDKNGYVLVLVSLQ